MPTFKLLSSFLSNQKKISQGCFSLNYNSQVYYKKLVTMVGLPYCDENWSFSGKTPMWVDRSWCAVWVYQTPASTHCSPLSHTNLPCLSEEWLHMSNNGCIARNVDSSELCKFNVPEDRSLITKKAGQNNKMWLVSFNHPFHPVLFVSFLYIYLSSLCLTIDKINFTTTITTNCMWVKRFHLGLWEVNFHWKQLGIHLYPQDNLPIWIVLVLLLMSFILIFLAAGLV